MNSVLCAVITTSFCYTHTHSLVESEAVTARLSYGQNLFPLMVLITVRLSRWMREGGRRERERREEEGERGGRKEGERERRGKKRERRERRENNMPLIVDIVSVTLYSTGILLSKKFNIYMECWIVSARLITN